MDIETQYKLVNNENWLPANMYVLTSISKRLEKMYLFPNQYSMINVYLKFDIVLLSGFGAT